MNPSEPIRVMVVDDHDIMRAGLVSMIDRESGMKVVAEAGDGRRAVEEFRKHKPDITLMDLRMPLMDGVEAIESIRKEFHNSRFIVLTTYDGDEDIYRALEAGAQAYLLKGMARNELFAAIRAVHSGLRYIPSVVTKSITGQIRSDLTKRELDVLKLLAAGRTNKEIAAAIDTTEGTIKSYVIHILDKLEVNDRTEAVTTAIKRGIIHL
ncbi:MAG TPA: response regulator transcription factor [Acidobacteriota bacterium]|nr:response regulator transcription factor [Acidobacteriota bacterium]